MAAGLQIRAAHFPGRAPIDAYGNGGFRFADMSHRGSILCLPSGIHGWDATAFDGLGEGDFARVLDEAGSFDILLVGTGPSLLPMPAPLRKRLREAGVAVETMSTGAAVRTYNVLLAEDRSVAAALIAVD
ncbi:Mth938-like domain-containing protein [Nitratireductor sp. ZSWI3]|uniref:Mth938-like domain-containing protein n=1 Tax=Nitratireductor sp. ZSWI3 TaxID=2966359 RepID=UPI0021502F18|nr:Mth938-like domain-containing protein [Nitratireductor sp. ZSWI3]MCR4267535.1 Mth938-like domain-containing protein [Nitratireductor sp. ZSWI3]